MTVLAAGQDSSDKGVAKAAKLELSTDASSKATGTGEAGGSR